MPNDEIEEGRNAVGGQVRTLARIEKTGAAFLVTDLDLAMTLTRIAGDAAEDSEKRHRNRANARRAYDSISRICNHALLAADDRQLVDQKLVKLRSALETLGEVFA